MSFSSIKSEFYEAPKQELWSGRVDSDKDFDLFRYHQVVKCKNLGELDGSDKIVLLGFASDEGVERNKGRIGASAGPNYFRENIGSLSWHGSKFGFTDVGNIFPHNRNLEEAHLQLSEAVKGLLNQNKTIFVIGGGHETAFGHYLGVAKHLMETNPQAKIGILNIDAHFDLREYNGVPHSGSPFLQAHEHAEENNLDLKYFVYGINPHNNTKALFKTAEKLETKHVTNREIFDSEAESLQKVQEFIENRTHIYLTVCLDVFKAGIAPGVSAPAWNGLELNHALRVLDLVKESGKLTSMDACELNPTFDENQKTAKLAGMLFSERIG